MSSVEFKEIMRFRKLWQMKIEIGRYKDQNALDNVEIAYLQSDIIFRD